MTSTTKINCQNLLIGSFAFLLVSFAASSDVFGQNQFTRLYEQFEKALAQRRFDDAETAIRQYLQLGRRGGHDQTVVIAIRSLGQLRYSQQKFAEAEQFTKQSLALMEKLGPDGSWSERDRGVFTAGIIDFLGRIYSRQGRYDEAGAAFKQVISLYQKLLGENHRDLWMPLYELAGTYIELEQFDNANATLQRTRRILESQKERDLKSLGFVIGAQAGLHHRQANFEKARQLRSEELALFTKLRGNDHPDVAHVLGNIALIYRVEGREAEAEKLLKRAIDITERAFGSNHLRVVELKQFLAEGYYNVGRFAEGEHLYKQALVIRERIQGPNHPNVAKTLMKLASGYSRQGRDHDALPFYRRALQIREKVFPPSHAERLRAVANVANNYREVGRLGDAEAMLKQCLELSGPESYAAHAFFIELGGVYHRQKRFADAEEALKKSIDIQEKFGNPFGFDGFLSVEYDGLALINRDMKQYEEAMQYSDRAIAIVEQSSMVPGIRAEFYIKRARIAWEMGRYEQSRSDLRYAMDLIDQHRSQLSGGIQQRAGAIVTLSNAYEHMVRLQTKLHNMDEALEAMERGRARSLLDQLASQGIDLLQGVPEQEASRLLQRQSKAKSRMAKLDQELKSMSQQKDIEPDARAAREKELRQGIRMAQHEFAVVQEDMRNVSPAFRLAVGKDQKPVALAELQSHLKKQNALLLRYLVGFGGSYVLIVPPNGPATLEPLEVSQAEATALDIKPGLLNAPGLQTALASKESGVLKLLRGAGSPTPKLAKQLHTRLAALYGLLIPDSVQQAITSESVDNMIVIPDGPLTTLPFEALVVEQGDGPVYVLDVAPPIQYAPSATVLYNLANRAAKSKTTGRKPVLSVGDPVYSSSKSSDQLATSSRYGRLGGQLKQLPYSKLESQWVSQVFEKRDQTVGVLTGAKATERQVTSNIPGRRIVHLACHGLTEPSYGNLFGALALTPGRKPVTSDDGFLSLSEIYELDMRGCELAILSACDTNYGPQQFGEGVWSLSRGFLVAGSRRVVASNWFVDDRAAASLISYFCSGLANAEGKSEVANYAEKLHKAKKWVRDQDQWSSPYYWATFVLVGPS